MRSPFTYLFLLGCAVGILACSRGDPSARAASGKPDTGMGPRTRGATDAWTDRWRKETFGDKDPAKVRAEFSRAAQAKLSEPGADPSDVMAKANALDRDPQKIFEFIRDRIDLEPYAGVLRGARGTLMAGAGNSLDRAILAQALLKACNIESRLIAGKLSDVQAGALLSRFLNGGGVPPILGNLVKTPDDSALGAEAADVSSRAGLPEAKVKELFQHARSRTKEFWAKTDAKRSTQFDFLVDQLQKGQVGRTVVRSALVATLKERLREHYWLELEEPDGRWTAFDPSFPDAKRGTTYGSAPVKLSEIPKEKYHQLEFSLVYRAATGGPAKDEVLVTSAFRSADALFTPLEFGIGPADRGVDLDAVASMDSKQLIDMLKKIKRFRPVLRAGPAVTSGRVFDLDGHTYDPADASPGNAGGSFFGDALGGGEEESSPQFFELRVVLRLTGPGRASKTQTRTLVRAEDLMQPTFAPPILRWEMLLQPQWLSAEFVGFNALQQTAQTADALTAAASGGLTGKAWTRLPPSVPLQLMELALLRQRAAAGILADKQGVRSLVDEPMLTILGQRVTELRVAEGQVAHEMHVDIVENSIRYVSRDDGSQPSAFDAALRQGVADCVLESEYLRELVPGADDRSATAILKQAQVEPRPAILARAQDSMRISGSGLPETDVAWIQANEPKESVLLIATTADGSGAWWSIRPDGNAILRARGGEGQAGVETATMEHEEGGVTFLYLLKFSAAVLCTVEASAAVLDLYEGDVSAHHAINAVVCMVAQWYALNFLVFEAHEASWALLGAEATWYGAQLSAEAGRHFAIHGFTIH